MNLQDRVKQAQETKRITDSLDDTLRKLWKLAVKQAGLDPTLAGIHPHNAKVSQNAGNPWKGIDYRWVDFALALERLTWLPSRMENMVWELYELTDKDTPEFWVDQIGQKASSGEYPYRFPSLVVGNSTD